MPISLSPDILRRLEIFKISSRRKFLGLRHGGHLSLKRGHGMEFSDYRQYEPGDNPRYIDWGLLARSDRLYVKTFQEEQNISILVVLDISSSMRLSSESEKWIRAGEIALAVSYIGLMQQERVVLTTLGDGTKDSLEKNSSAKIIGAQGSKVRSTSKSPLAIARTPQDFFHLKELLNSCLAVNFQSIADLKRSLAVALSSIKFPGVAVFISDLLYPSEQIIAIADTLASRNYDTTVIQILGEEDLDPLYSSGSSKVSADGGLLVEDSETGELVEINFGSSEQAAYNEALREQSNSAKKILARRGIKYVLTSTREDLSDLLSVTLTKSGLLR